MEERERIVHDDYPVERLPEDLRAGLGAVTRVRVTVEADAALPAAERRRRWKRMKALIEARRQEPGFKVVTTSEAAARIRALRDEWDD
jgi:hypothetical protein